MQIIVIAIEGTGARLLHSDGVTPRIGKESCEAVLGLFVEQMIEEEIQSRLGAKSREGGSHEESPTSPAPDS